MKKRGSSSTKLTKNEIDNLIELSKNNDSSKFQYCQYLLGNDCLKNKLKGLEYLFELEEKGYSKAENYLIKNIKFLYNSFLSKNLKLINSKVKFGLGKYLINIGNFLAGYEILTTSEHPQAAIYLKLYNYGIKLNDIISLLDKIFTNINDNEQELVEESLHNRILDTDDKKIVFYNIFKSFADSGCAVSQFLLAIFLITTIGYDINDGIAYLQTSAENGYSKSQYFVSLLYLAGRYNYSKNNKEAFYWCNLSAKQGYGPAEYKISLYYNNSIGTKKNEVEAFNYMKKAVQSEYSKSNLQMGIYYKSGIGVNKDSKLAIKYLTAAIYKNKDVEACYIYGIMLFEGDGVEKDIDKAILHLNVCSEKGHIPSKYILGDCYYHGVGLEQNYNMACEYYKEAAKQGYSKAIYKLGLCYLKGEGVSQNTSIGLSIIKNIEEDLPDDDIKNIIRQYKSIIKKSKLN